MHRSKRHFSITSSACLLETQGQFERSTLSLQRQWHPTAHTGSNDSFAIGAALA
jgi:hypothetical protein